MITIVYFYTKHALEKMDALGIDKSEAELVITRGMKWKEEKRDGIWHASMGNLEVVFGKEDSSIVIITVYLARREK